MAADEVQLDPEQSQDNAFEVVRPKITRSVAANLYVSHALSTWNARGYEFATILFTAAAYPDTLSAAALRMMLVFLAMVIFSANVGSWIESSPNRLWTLRTTILMNRGSVIIASFIWLPILSQADLIKGEAVYVLPKNDILKGLLFAVAIALGIIERLSASGNMISMERDWVVTMAAPIGQPYDLTHLNAVMRRIDLVCKLISPIFISAIISAVDSMRFGVLFTGFTSLVCLPIELFSAKRAWSSSETLQQPKPVPLRRTETAGATIVRGPAWMTAILEYFSKFKVYFLSTVWIPSAALAMLHYSMLTWRPTFITYLINIGYSLNFITIARAIGSLFEISSTVLTPIGIRRLGHTREVERSGSLGDDDDEAAVPFIESENDKTQDVAQDERTVTGLERTGLLGITLQVVFLVPVVLALWGISTPADVQIRLPSIGISLVIFGFLAVSRLGVWVFDLTTQQLTQMLVDERQRSAFAGVENSVVYVFDLLGAGSAIVFPRTEQFKWLVLASWVVVAFAWAIYVGWVRHRRGSFF